MDARSIRSTIFFLAVAVLPSKSAWAQDVVWWKPNTWIKTADADDAGVRKSAFFENTSKNTTEKSLFSMPQMPWAASEKSSTKPAGQSMLGKMGQSTKNAWNSTVDFMNPFDSAPAAKPQGYQPQNFPKTTSKGSGMFGWLWREEKTEAPGSVNEFLRQERPKF